MYRVCTVTTVTTAHMIMHVLHGLIVWQGDNLKAQCHHNLYPNLKKFYPIWTFSSIKERVS